MYQFATALLVVLASFSVSAQERLEEQCPEACKEAIQLIESQKENVDTVWGNHRMKAIVQIEKIALDSPFLSVRLKALEILDTPIQNHDGNTRAYTIDLVKRIALSSSDATVEVQALNLLKKPADSSIGDITQRAMDSAAEIGVKSNNAASKLQAIEVLKIPGDSHFFVIRDYASKKMNLVNATLK